MRRDPGVDRRSARGAGDRVRRGARAEAVQPLRARVPARLPRRLARALRGRPTSQDRGARGRRGPIMQPVPAARVRRGRDAAAASCSAPAVVSLSDVLPTFEHMGAKVVDERPYEISPRAATKVWIYDFGLRGVAEDVERDPRDVPGHVPGGAPRRARGRRPQRARARGRAERARDHDRPRDRQVPAPGRHRVLGRVHAAHAAAATRRRGAAGEAVLRAFDPDGGRRAGRAAGGGDRAGDRRGAPASTRTASCAASYGGAATLRTNYFRTDDDAPPRRTSRSSSTRRRSRCYRCRGRTSRSSSTRRASRACTCAAARSPAAGCAGRTGRRTSAPRSSGLMKAQMVKNALIVPVGAKGGFVVKRPRATTSAPSCSRRSIACYRQFLRVSSI